MCVQRRRSDHPALSRRLITEPSLSAWISYASVDIHMAQNKNSDQWMRMRIIRFAGHTSAGTFFHDELQSLHSMDMECPALIKLRWRECDLVLINSSTDCFCSCFAGRGNVAGGGCMCVLGAGGGGGVKCGEPRNSSSDQCSEVTWHCNVRRPAALPRIRFLYVCIVFFFFFFLFTWNDIFIG